MLHLNAGLLQEVNAVRQPVVPCVDHAGDAGLDNQLGAFNARRVGDVERGAVRVVAGAGNFRDGIGFGVQHVRQCQPILALANVGEAGGRSVVSVADNHVAFDYQGSHLAARAVRVFGPDACHAQIAAV